MVANQSNRFSSPMESTLYCECGRSWALNDTPNLTGVERKNEQKICLDIQLPNELSKQKGGI